VLSNPQNIQFKEGQSIQQGDYTLGSYLTENDSKINHQVREVGEMDSKSLSEASKLTRNDSFQSQQYNITIYLQPKINRKMGRITEL